MGTIRGNFNILFVVCFFVWFGAMPCLAKYGGGTGTASDPYLINTAAQMNQIGLNPDDRDNHFVLTADIDLSAYASDEFNIIGDDVSYPFSGVFDGRGHTIFNFTYDSLIWGVCLVTSAVKVQL